ncbi:hypothetical protein ACHWQZ_G008403 [Mnemiopsis leidyi]
MEDENDSDKENKDPSTFSVLNQTPLSKKKRGKRRKERGIANLSTLPHTYPLEIDEGAYVFLKGIEVWHPGKIMQVTSPYRIICYSFLDTSITVAARSKLSSFLNYGCKVDFDLLESDETYQKGIIDCIASFAEIHRPDLLKLPDRDLMLLDWARLGFVGCLLIQSNIPQILVDYKTENDLNQPTFCVDEEKPSSSRDWDEDDCTPTKRRKLSLHTEDSGYSSPVTPSVLKSPLATLSIDQLQSSSNSSDHSSEVGCYVLGKLVRYGWWPGLIADPRKSPRPCLPNERLVYWFGDCTKSLIDIKDIAPITKFPDVYQPSKKGIYRVALYDFLSDAAESCNYTEINAPDSVNIDESALTSLIQWAMDGFTPGGPPRKWAPSEHYHSIEKDRFTRRIEMAERTNNGSACVACQNRDSIHPHPLFEGHQLCDTCMEDFSQCAYLFGDDGAGSYCSVCNEGGNLFICDQSQCGRPYCPACISRVCGPHSLLQVEKSDPWFCVLCNDTGSEGDLVKRPDWQARLQDLLTRKVAGEEEYQTPLPPPVPPISERSSLRVLSLFDGISTGLVTLKNIGFQIETYVSSEVDEEAIKVSKLHHPEVVQIGDIASLTPQKVSDLGPFDLVMGGSPCNDLSNVNPFRKGIYEGTGRLFFEFYRILSYVKESAGDRPVFWMFENVVSMSRSDRNCISRFLQSSPNVIDAKHFSCMSRARYFWGNLPGMARTPVPLATDKLTLQDCLEQNCGREARFEKINCITTKLTSMKQKKGRTLPVRIAGDEEGPGDWLWCTEMERVFGLPSHYTDVANMSRFARQRLLGKAWSVPVLRHLLSPLRDYFMCQQR